MSTSREPELTLLRKLADDLAARRSERVSTAHLLASVSARPGSAAELLRDRRLDSEVLLKAARVVTDDANDAIEKAMQRARDFSTRSSSREPSAVHLLFALCHDRHAAAHRAIEQCGIDVTKLRAAAMQLALGISQPRRLTELPPPAMSRASIPQTPARGELPRSRSMRVPIPQAQRPPSNPIPTSISPMSPTTISTATKTMGPSKKSRIMPATPIAKEAKFTLDPKKYPLLCQIGKNLTLAGVRGELDKVVGRDEEVERTLDVLAKRRANNPCLIGVPGVGKTTVVRGLAQRIAEGEYVASLDDRVVIEIEPHVLLAGTGMRGALAERFAQMKQEVARSDGRIVLFFDEIHSLFVDGGDEIATPLKLALAQGELTCIGSTSIDEYRRVIDSDPALSRRFTAIEVLELSPEESFMALEQLAPALGAHHHARYTPEALARTVNWSVRYLPGRALPDKAIGILDLAGARARRRRLTEVSPEQIAEVVSEIAGVPTERLLETDGDRMLRLESLMAERIVGHSKALAKIATVLRRNASGFRSKRPIGSFLLLGPTGVGKTETAKAIAECLFFSPDAMTRLDLSEYAEPHAIARLVGAPPGYIGHDAGGQLTEAVRRRPYQVILLDEIEKAHRDVLEAFLPLFDEGRLTDGRGRTIDFTNTVIILTSNLGADVSPTIATRGKIGFGAKKTAPEDASAYETAVVASARADLPPEFYNRLDEVIAFAPLTRADVAEVARRILATLGEELFKTRGIRLDASEASIDALLDGGGFDPELGARPMRRAIGRMIEAPLSDLILRGEISRGDVATIDVENGEIIVDAVTPASRITA